MKGTRKLLALAMVGLPSIFLGCSHEIESPPVSATTVQPDLVCTEQLTTTVTLTGDGFTPAPENTLDNPFLGLPTIKLDRSADLTGASASGSFTIPDDPARANESRVKWLSEQQMSFEVFPELSLQPGLYDITVTNPDGIQAATFSGGLTAVPRPTATGIAPDILCNDQADQSVTLTGMNFLGAGSKMPIVRVGDRDFPVNQLDNCVDVPGTHADGQVRECSTATFLIPQGTLSPGSYDVTVTNPEPANCASSDVIKLVVVPPPSLASIEPDLICNAQGDETMVVTGSDFLVLGNTMPTIALGTQAFTPTSVDNCMPIDGQFTEGAAQSCTSMTFTIPAGTLPDGDYPVVVTNPAPADCKSTESINLHVAPPPSITALNPIAVCEEQGAQTIAIDGLGFLQVGQNLPTVTIGTQVFTASGTGGCMPVPGMFAEGTVEECTSITVTIPQGSFAPGTYPVTVTNPLPADCSSTEMITLEVRDPPTVSSVTPAAMCTGGGNLQITGTGFVPGATVTLEAAGQPTLTSSMTTVNAAGTQIDAQIPGGAMVGTVYDVVVSNGDGCQSAPFPQVTIVPGPIAFFADPDVVYNGINTRVTVYATTLTLPLPANAVEIVPTGQSAPITTLTWTPVPNYPNRVQVVVPAGQAPGVYDLYMHDATSCTAFLPQAITVTDALQVAIKSVVPPFGYTGSQTDVTIFRDTMAAAPLDKPFVATPRVFLNPANPQPNDIAIQLQSVSFKNADTLTAVVPRNQPANNYDMIVINPDGTVGLLLNAFEVKSVPPPVITSVTPSSIIAAAGQNVLVAGQFFDTSTISLTCKDPMGNPTAPPPVTSGPVNCTGNDCTQQATIDGSALSVGSICVLRLTNADGSYYDYSAIGVTTPSLNLSAPTPGPAMNVGRRALVAASGNATSAARFVYAIGGDGGQAMANMPFTSVESAQVDLFGGIGAWELQRNQLSTPRAFAGGVKVGRYIYMLGGTDGTTALNSAERARILDPLEVPELNIDDLIPASAGLDAGYWIYRVSAIFSATDPDNPNGESLASEPIIVKVPSLPGQKIQVALGWKPPADSLGVPLPNVTGYRVYRTPNVNGISGQEVLLATVNMGTKYTDDGTATPGTEKPLPIGSTGKWAALPPMGSGRVGLAAAAGFDPADPQKLTFYVYALLGRDGTNTALNTYEFLPVSIEANGHQTAGATWIGGANAFAAGRWQLSTWVADSTVSSTIPVGETWIFAGGGLQGAATFSNKVEAGKVGAGGDLGVISDLPKDFPASHAGYGVCAANGQLFLFGGQGGGPTSGAKAATLMSPAPNLTAQSWNAEGLTMTDARYLMGSTVQSAFIFLVGGQTGASPASTSTELVIW